MSNDTKKNSVNEMEQIQKGLEAFLQQELQEIQMENQQNSLRSRQQTSGNKQENIPHYQEIINSQKQAEDYQRPSQDYRTSSNYQRETENYQRPSQDYRTSSNYQREAENYQRPSQDYRTSSNYQREAEDYQNPSQDYRTSSNYQREAEGYQNPSQNYRTSPNYQREAESYQQNFQNYRREEHYQETSSYQQNDREVETYRNPQNYQQISPDYRESVTYQSTQRNFGQDNSQVGDIEKEREFEIIGTQKQNSNKKSKVLEDTSLQDWDDPKQKRKAKASQNDKKKSSSKEKSSSAKAYIQEEAEEKPKKSRKKRKKKHRFLKFLLKVMILFALLGGIAYYITYSVVGKVYNKMEYNPIDSVASDSMKKDGVINILLIGNDSRENGQDGRSDAMILLSISNQTESIYMTSLLRDMYVEIPGYDNNRLNSAYSFGGPELLMETIEKNFDIEVNRYVSVNFEAFANLIDAVGGIDLELTSEEIEYINGYLVEYNMLTNRPEGTDYMDTSLSGMVHLNGPQALAYSRNRYLGTDFGRTERQRKVLEAAIQKVPSALVNNPTELIATIMPNLTTNLTQKECFELGLNATKLVIYDIVQGSIPLEGTYENVTIREMSVLEVDFETNKQYLKENIYGEQNVQ